MIIELGKVTEETKHDGYPFDTDALNTPGHRGS
jgi:hypothetical protein